MLVKKSNFLEIAKAVVGLNMCLALQACSIMELKERIMAGKCSLPRAVPQPTGHWYYLWHSPSHILQFFLKLTNSCCWYRYIPVPTTRVVRLQIIRLV